MIIIREYARVSPADKRQFADPIYCRHVQVYLYIIFEKCPFETPRTATLDRANTDYNNVRNDVINTSHGRIKETFSNPSNYKHNCYYTLLLLL